MYESEQGARCQVHAQRPAMFKADGGYNKTQEGYVSFGFEIPLGNEAGGLARECADMGKQDQARSRFTWLLELYEAGTITRATMEAEAAKLGIELAPEKAEESGGFTLTIP